jgi:anti-sigma factor RsiW
MKRSLTPTDILRYVYGETNEKEEQEVKNAILTNDKFADEFINISESKALLDRGMYSASAQTIQNILNYSKSQLRESAF